MALTNKNGLPLIPAIMQANSVMSKKMPFLGRYFSFNNKILGSVINAKEMNDGWVLENGQKIDFTMATNSLLKSLTLSAVGIPVAIVSAVVVLIKKMVKKVQSLGNRINKADDFEKRINYLIKQYNESGVRNVGLFAEMYHLSEEEIDVLKANVQEGRGR